MDRVSGDRGRQSRDVNRNREDEDEIEKQMGSGVDRAERRKHDETEIEIQCQKVVEQVTEVPRTSSRDRTLQCTEEQILDVLVPETAKQLMEMPETVSQDRIKQRTVEQIVDAPVPQAVKELADVFRVFSQERIQQRAMEQITPATSLAEMIVEVPVIQTPERTQQVVNTSVQHIVDTVEVQKPTIQEKINQVTKHIKIPHVSDIPVVAPRQILPMTQTVQKTTEIPQLQFPDQVVDVPLAFVVLVPQMQVVPETVEISQLDVVECVKMYLAGLVKPDDPDAQIKFLAAEALHGMHRNRFDKELSRRDCVMGEMWKNKPPFRLALNRAASDEIARHCKHCTEREVMKLHESGTALAEGMEVPVSKMEELTAAHCQASLKTVKDPDRGPYPAYPSGKSWCEACGKTGSGKKFHHNVMSGSRFRSTAQKQQASTHQASNATKRKKGREGSRRGGTKR